jgi:hypothetical protein
MEELNEDAIQYYAQKYEELTTKTEAIPEWDENAFRAKSDFFADFMKNPSNEKLTHIKDTIESGLHLVKRRSQTTNREIEIIEEQETRLQEIHTPNDMRMIVNFLAGTIQNPS